MAASSRALFFQHFRKRGARSVDVEQETKNFKFALIAVLVFAISAFYSCEEVKYSTGGKLADGTVDNVSESIGRRGRPVRQVHYHYRDEEGDLRKAVTPVARDWQPPADGKVAVQYLEDSSRLVGQRNMGALVMFFASLVALAVGGFLFWRHVRAATAGPRRPSYLETVRSRR